MPSPLQRGCSFIRPPSFRHHVPEARVFTCGTFAHVLPQLFMHSKSFDFTSTAEPPEAKAPSSKTRSSVFVFLEAPVSLFPFEYTFPPTADIRTCLSRSPQLILFTSPRLSSQPGNVLCLSFFKIQECLLLLLLFSPLRCLLTVTGNNSISVLKYVARS